MANHHFFQVKLNYLELVNYICYFVNDNMHLLSLLVTKIEHAKVKIMNKKWFQIKVHTTPTNWQGFKTDTLWAYHPVLWELLWIATMEVEEENTICHNSGILWTKFFAKSLVRWTVLFGPQALWQTSTMQTRRAFKCIWPGSNRFDNFQGSKWDGMKRYAIPGGIPTSTGWLKTYRYLSWRKICTGMLKNHTGILCIVSWV